MSTNPVSTSNMWPNYSKGNISNKGNKSQEMGKDQFLSILITQLRHQDPLQPMQDREFIAQMAQFTSLEQLMNINTQLTSMSQSLGTASSLIGKQITWMAKEARTDELTWTKEPTDKTNLVMKSGIVESIVVRDGIQYAKVGDSEVVLSDILKIENAPIEPGGQDQTGSNPETAAGADDLPVGDEQNAGEAGQSVNPDGGAAS